jgi:hypothetical protein
VHRFVRDVGEKFVSNVEHRRGVGRRWSVDLGAIAATTRIARVEASGGIGDVAIVDVERSIARRTVRGIDRARVEHERCIGTRESERASPAGDAQGDNAMHLDE